MTVSSTTRKAGPFNGNGVATAFPFTFKVFDKTDVKVVIVNASGASTTMVLDSDYSVLLNSDQDSAPGGTVSYPISGAPLPTNYQLVVLGSLAIDQETDITNQGGFYPQVIEDMVDRATIQIQQIAEIAGRAIVVTEAESSPPTLPPASERAGTILGFDASGDVTTLPIPAAIGAGDMRDETGSDGKIGFLSGTDFINGTTTTFALSRSPGSKGNVQVFFDAAYQGGDQILSILGNVLTLTAPVPVGVQRVYVRTGTTLSIFEPADGSVGPAQLADAYGPTAGRPVPTKVGQSFFDTTLGQPVFSYGIGAGDWGNAAGFTPSVGDNSLNIATTAFTNVALHSILAFGGKGDGVTDNTAALNAALAAASAAGRAIVYFPAGVYVFNSQIAYTFPNANASLTIMGDGADLTELRWPNATSGLLINYLGAFNSSNFRDFSITTGQNNTATAIFLNQTAATVPNPALGATNQFKNVVFRGSDGYGLTNVWAFGVGLNAVSNIIFDTCTFVGNSTSTRGIGVSLLGTNSGLQGVAYNFTNCFFTILNIGIVYGQWTQGLSVLSSNFTGCQIGVQAPLGPGGQDELLVAGCQINCAQFGITTPQPVPDVLITSNLFIMPLNGSIGVYMPLYSFTSISANHFGGLLNSGTVGVRLTQASGLAQPIINGNHFTYLGTGVALDSASTNVNVQSNGYTSDVAIKVGNLGTGNIIGGGSP